MSEIFWQLLSYVPESHILRRLRFSYAYQIALYGNRYKHPNNNCIVVLNA